MSEKLNDNECDAVALWAEIHRLRAQAKGPDGFETWMGAAISERLRRVDAEKALRRLKDELQAGHLICRIYAIGLMASRAIMQLRACIQRGIGKFGISGAMDGRHLAMMF